MIRTLVAALALTGTASAVSPEYSENTDYEIYSAALDALYGQPQASDSGKRARFVLFDSTAASGLVTAGLRTEFMRRQFGIFSSMYEGTLDNFHSRNQAAVKLSARGFETKGTVELLSRKSLPSTAGDPEVYWREFYRRYPRARGIISLSQPGYDKSGRYALIYFRTGCGSLCGEAGYALFRRFNGSWVMLRRVITIMS